MLPRKSLAVLFRAAELSLVLPALPKTSFKLYWTQQNPLSPASLPQACETRFLGPSETDVRRACAGAKLRGRVCSSAVRATRELSLHSAEGL